MKNSKIKIGFLIYTHNRIDDARINMEIIESIWKKSGLFSDIKVVHCYNGGKKKYPEKYLEDELVSIKNSWHFQGASDLIDVGIKTFQEKYKNIDYIIVLASDTWITKPKYIENVLNEMKKDKLYLATCPWGLPERNEIRDVGMAVDFFIVDLKWASKYKMFPISYGDFCKKYEDLFLYQKGGNVMLEKLLYAKYVKAVGREENSGGVARKKLIEKLLILKDREPVHSHIDNEENWIRKKYWPKMGLITHHNPTPKREILKKLKSAKGKHIQKLLKSNNAAYYNNGIR